MSATESVLLAVAREHSALFEAGAIKSQWEFFEYSVKLAMARWTALRMAVEGEWGGGDMRRKYEMLLEEVLNVFKYSKVVYADDMADDLSNYVEAQFGLICEDGSVEELAEFLTVLADECKRGEYARVKELHDKAQSMFPIDLKSAKLRTEGGGDHAMDAIAEEDMQDDAQAQQQQHQQQEETVDEDGFSTVRRSSRRKAPPKLFDPSVEFPGAQ
jgi:pre-rRNA-processing protein TSR2